MNHYGNGQIVLNDWTAVRVTVGKEGVYGMTEREGYENPTYLSALRKPGLLAPNLTFTPYPHSKHIHSHTNTPISSIMHKHVKIDVRLN